MSARYRAVDASSTRRRAACLEVLDRVRREELHRAGDSAVDSDAFAGAELDFELLCVTELETDEVVGVVRITRGVPLRDVPDADAEYLLSTIEDVLLERTVVLTRLAIVPEHRATEAGIVLYRDLYRRFRAEGTQLVLLSCEPGLIPLYEMLGARIYGRVHNAPRGGFRVPMVFVMDDDEHFAAVGSPVVATPPAGTLATAHDPPVAASGLADRARRWLDERRRGLDPGVEPADATQVPEGVVAALTRGLGDDGRTQLLAEAHVVAAQQGDVVLREGDGSQFVFVVLDGGVEVIRAGEHVADGGVGDVFGEMARVGDGRRTATVRTTAPTRLLVLAQRAQDKLIDARDRAAFERNVAALLAARREPPSAPDGG